VPRCPTTALLLEDYEVQSLDELCSFTTFPDGCGGLCRGGITPKNGGWGDWVDNGGCDQFGPGQRQFRSCSNPYPVCRGRPCEGSNQQFIPCRAFIGVTAPVGPTPVAPPVPIHTEIVPIDLIRPTPTPITPVPVPPPTPVSPPPRIPIEIAPIDLIGPTPTPVPIIGGSFRIGPEACGEEGCCCGFGDFSSTVCTGRRDCVPQSGLDRLVQFLFLCSPLGNFEWFLLLRRHYCRRLVVWLLVVLHSRCYRCRGGMFLLLIVRFHIVQEFFLCMLYNSQLQQPIFRLCRFLLLFLRIVLVLLGILVVGVLVVLLVLVGLEH